MRKKTIIILTIISTILSLIFSILIYLGISRYISLRIKNNDELVEQYSKLPEASKDRVIIIFSTSAERINNIKPMINSILDQTTKVDQIIMVIPKGEKYDIPTYLKDIVTIIPSGKKYKFGTKLITVLLREKDCDTMIIPVDDNTIYGKDFIEFLINESENNPDSVLIDNNDNIVLFKPEHYGCDVVNREKEEFHKKWFIEHAKKNTVINYSENYRF